MISVMLKQNRISLVFKYNMRTIQRIFWRSNLNYKYCIMRIISLTELMNRLLILTSDGAQIEKNVVNMKVAILVNQIDL